MIILATDTSTAFNSVAVCACDEPAATGGDVRILAETVVHADRKHSERLLETVDRLLGEADLHLSDIDLLGVSRGPGSFTGLRVGISTWQGLAVGLGVPLIGVPTLDALAKVSALADGTVCALLDARMQEVFGAVYSVSGGAAKKIVDDRVCPVEAIAESIEAEAPLFIGEGAQVYRDRIAASCPGARFAPDWMCAPRATAVASIALAHWRECGAGDPESVQPVYLRMSQPEELRRETLQKADAQ